MPKRKASCRLPSGRIFNRYATVINVSDGVLQKILFQDKILKTSTGAGLFFSIKKKTACNSLLSPRSSCDTEGVQSNDIYE